ncbi:hypothetical protein [Geothermobacter hydrogeniphilus]|uniref:Uncharacterized protein n=1 Tax=Geothermobacter hydrogeniphilus TaxID=1969733 RepID=A0A1X0XI41_9BACT|nr:hypothetical protein [Geothermobacter hydrogeniphilus]ORJ52555.1 hypothetical protein B5V00_16735 [Geothermobacter hydrogeniphilus]
MNIQISPNYTYEKLESMNVDDFIDIFEDRTRVWLLDTVSHLLELEHGYFAAISLLLTYFEGIAIYLEGRDSQDKSKAFFKKGFVDVFKKSGFDEQLLNKIGSEFYSEARCGFFHDGMFRNKILISFMKKEALTITFPKIDGILDLNGNIESIIVNPKSFFDSINFHFESFISDLKNKTNIDLRSKFEGACLVKWKPTEPGPIVGFEEPK